MVIMISERLQDIKAWQRSNKCGGNGPVKSAKHAKKRHTEPITISNNKNDKQ